MNIKLQMIEKFQCPGCVIGHNVKCGKCNIEEPGFGFRCGSHCSGTSTFSPAGVVNINLGLPIGFCRVTKPRLMEHFTNIRLHESMTTYSHDKFNVPVWAMEDDGYLIIRTFLPRIDRTYVDVVKDGKISDLPPHVFNVAEFQNEMD